MKILFFALSFFAFLFTNGQFVLDTTFNNPTLEPKNVRGFNKGLTAIEDMVLQKDGKIIVVGIFQEYNGRKRNGICRILPNGEIDESFIVGSGVDARINKIKLQPDGKILLLGQFRLYNNIPCVGFVRLNENGTIDKSFEFPQTIYGRINDILITPDAKILVGGRFNNYNGNPVKSLIRLNTNGSLDRSFNLVDGFEGEINSIALQKNKILIGGEFSIYLGGNNRIHKFTRLAPDGSSLDIGFNIGAKGFEASNGSISLIHVQNDNKILLSGSFKKYNDTEFPGGFIRLNENGWIDKKFNNNNKPIKLQQIQQQFKKIYTADDGSIYVCGDFENIGNNIKLGFAKFDVNGKIDVGFNKYEFFIHQKPIVNTFLQLPNGNFIVGGVFDYIGGFQRNLIALLNSNGTTSTQMFYLKKGVDGIVTHIVPYKGKYLLAGQFNTYNDEAVNSLILIDEKGDRDYSFSFSSLNYVAEAFADLKVLKNNQILIAGIFKATNSNTESKLLKLNENGNVDETFYIGSVFEEYVYAVDEQNDGKIIVGGNFKKIDGMVKVGIARINTDGTIDNSFNSNNNLELSINKLLVDRETNKIYVSGRYAHPTKRVYINLQRLMPNGNIDNSFNNSLFENKTIKGFTTDNNKRLLVYGSINTAKGVAEIVRIDNDGNYDPSFIIDSKFYKYGNYVNRVIVLPNNDILVGFQSPPNGETIFANNSIIKLNNNGTVNTGFKFSTNMQLGIRGELYGTLNACILLNDNTVLVGGNFNYLDGFYIDYLTKLKLVSTATEVNTSKQPPTITSKSNNNNSTAISPKAKLIFNGVKTKLSNEDKNTIAEELTLLKYSAKSKKLILSLDDNEESMNDDDEFSPSFDLNIYNTDLNKDGNEEVFITISSSMFMGTQGVPTAIIFMKINGKFEKVFEGEAYVFRVNQNNKSANPELCIADEQKFIKSTSILPGSLLVFKDGKYNIVKTKHVAAFKWANVEQLSKAYQKLF